MSGEEKDTSKYFLKRKFRIPKGESTRDYHNYKPIYNANDLLLPCDWEDFEEEYYVARNKDSFTKR